MLWLALVFPRLPLEVAGGPAQASAAGACVVERGRVQVVDDTAAAAGLLPGMRLSTARGMLPEARIVERDAALLTREAAALDEFACFAGGITPTVCIAPPATLLLDIGGSLRLFGGLRPVLCRLFEGAAERGLGGVAGLAPTPRAAEWLALGQAERLALAQPGRAGRGARAATGPVPPEGIAATLAACALTREAIPELIGRLPIAVIGGREDIQSRIAGFGLRRIGDLLALPRAALAQRVGPAVGESIAQALGDLPDPRVPFAFPERFRQTVELPGTVSDAAMLAFPARRLIGDLCGWLAARQAGAAACTLHLLAERRGVPPVTVRLALAGASRDPARFERLLREKLAQVALAAPVGDLVLEAGGEGCEQDVADLPGETAGLFDRRRPDTPLDVLVERLRARFGDAAVHGLAVVPEHRPECATRRTAVGLPSSQPGTTPERPLWLLPEPELLPEVQGRPTRRGEVLELVGGPERIESGWWDEGESGAGQGEGVAGVAAGAAPGAAVGSAGVAAGRAEIGSETGTPRSGQACASPGDVRRDYFFARTPAGQCWWIYRDAQGWWGQGLGVAAR